MTHSITRRWSHLLPFLLWSIVTAAAVLRTPESNGVTNIFTPESTGASMRLEYSLDVLGLTGVIFISVSSLVHTVAKVCDGS